jgi:glycosyltransferase involved in cell wall biosynthesis
VERSLNILFVADVSIAKVIGGAERVLYEQTTRLTRRGHEVSVLTRMLPSHDSAISKIAGVWEWRYPFQRNSVLGLAKSILWDPRRTFLNLGKHSSFHLINAHQPFSALGVFSCPHRETARVYTCHSLAYEEYISRSPVPKNAQERLTHRCQVAGRKMVERAVLNRSDHILVLSEYTRQKLLTIHGVAATKISVLPGGVDVERFKPLDEKRSIRRALGLPEKDRIFFTVRNLVPRMGLENFISAFRTVLSRCKDVLLVIGGEGPLGPSLKDQAKREGLDDFVRFVGFIPEEQLPTYYQAADLFILPTRELEGFGLVTVEALASGLPVLGTPVGGTKEILTKLGSDHLFEDLTPDSMARGIIRALDHWCKDSQIYKRVSHACRAVAEQSYSWDVHVSRLEELFCRVIERHVRHLR